MMSIYMLTLLTECVMTSKKTEVFEIGSAQIGKLGTRGSCRRFRVLSTLMLDNCFRDISGKRFVIVLTVN